jgi:hypothetical protein
MAKYNDLAPQRPKPNEPSPTRCPTEGETTHGSLTGDGETVEAVHCVARSTVARPHRQGIADDITKVSPRSRSAPHFPLSDDPPARTQGTERRRG